MSQLKVFVSSTCYDLSQIRTDLFEFLSIFGYQPILSEYSSFPIDPDSDTIDNCIQNVKTADLFILIIGNRYGYVADTGKSITNTEYLYAKEQGIPTYIFIHKPLITILPIWKVNPSADFSGTVDSTKVFEFVDELRSSNKNWCHDFEKAQDIIGTLKIQLSHLFKSALDIRQKFSTSHQPEYWKNLSSAAIKLAIDKDDMFEPLFFAQVLKDELMNHESLKLDLDYHILLGCNKGIQKPLELLAWLDEKLTSLQQFINSGMNLMGKAYPIYWGEPGEASDLRGLYYVASSLARLYKEMILWSIDIKSTYVINDFETLRDAFADFIIISAEGIWNYPDSIKNDISNAIMLIKQGQKASVECVLTFEMSQTNADFFSSEMARLIHTYTSKY